MAGKTRFTLKALICSCCIYDKHCSTVTVKASSTERGMSEDCLISAFLFQVKFQILYA